MELEELIGLIAERGYKGEYYRITLVLPKAMLGKGRKYELYHRGFGDAQPWTNGDCGIPVEHVEGALVEDFVGVKVDAAFIIPLDELVPFAEDLWLALKKYDYDIEVKEDETTVGNKT